MIYAKKDEKFEGFRDREGVGSMTRMIVESLWCLSRFTRGCTNVGASKSRLYIHNEARVARYPEFAHIPICLLIQRAFQWLVGCKSWNSRLRLPLLEFELQLCVRSYIYPLFHGMLSDQFSPFPCYPYRYRLPLILAMLLIRHRCLPTDVLVFRLNFNQQ